MMMRMMICVQRDSFSAHEIINKFVRDLNTNDISKNYSHSHTHIFMMLLVVVATSVL
jgi:hypothetical protein